MESTAYFEKKIYLSPSEFNEFKTSSVEELLLRKTISQVEKKCSEHGFVLPGSIKILSRSMGYFEAARFTGDVIYYVKFEARVIYPVDNMELEGVVMRKNKMGLYVNYKDAIHIQIPRDLHIGNLEYDQVEVGHKVVIRLKRSKFAIHDPYILASGVFVSSEFGVREEEEEEEPSEEMEAPARPLQANEEAKEEVREEEEEEVGDEEEEEEAEEEEEPEEEEMNADKRDRELFGDEL